MRRLLPLLLIGLLPMAALGACNQKPKPAVSDEQAAAAYERVAPGLSELERSVGEMLRDHPFRCSEARSSEQFRHATVTRVREALPALMAAAGMSFAEVVIECPGSGIGVAPKDGPTFGFLGRTQSRGPRTLSWGRFEADGVPHAGIVVTSITPLQKEALRVTAYYTLDAPEERR